MALSIVGTPNTSTTTSCTVGTHAVDDLLVAVVSGSMTGVQATKPSASGTVPAWIDGPSNQVGNIALRLCYVKATATNHTSGTWTGSAAGIIMMVVRGQHLTTPNGGATSSAVSGFSSPVSAPSATLTDSSGASLLLHAHAAGATAWSGAPTNYTRRAAVIAAGSAGTCLNTKDDTTSDGSVNQAFTPSGFHTGLVGITFEILVAAAPTSTTDFFPFIIN